MQLRYLFVLSLLYFVECKINKALTESLGQEVIEIGAPIKELPDLEEEPSAENEEDRVTSTTVQVATKKDGFKRNMITSGKAKDVEKSDSLKSEDEETRIEKELAEIYKDTADYKSDSAEVMAPKTTNITEDKPIARTRTNFKFQPNANNPAEVEKFRTSVDVISCDKTKLSGTTIIPKSSSNNNVASKIIFGTVISALALM